MSKWISRKLVMALLTPVVALIGQRFGLDEDTIQIVVGAIAAYILGQSAVDLMAAKNIKPAAPQKDVPPVTP